MFRKFLERPISARTWGIGLDASLFFWFCAASTRFGILVFSENPWMFGEWLIDYSEGFGRRGLGGEIIGLFGFGHWTNVQFAAQILYMVLLAINILLVRNLVSGERSLTALCLMFAPGAFLVFVADPGYSGRKEILLIILVLSAIWLARKRGGTATEFVLLGLSWAAMGLIHEGLLVFAPAAGAMFFAIAGVRYGPWKRWLFSLLPSFSAGVVGISLLLFSSERSPNGTCVRWVELGASEALCEGAISWIGRDLEFATTTTTTSVSLHYWATYLPFLMGSIALLVFLFRRAQLHFDPKTAVFFAFTAAGLGIISFLSIDWGRWLHSSFTISLLFIFAYARKSNSSVHRILETPRFKELVVIVAFYVLLSPPHYGTEFQSPLLTFFEAWVAIATKAQ